MQLCLELLIKQLYSECIDIFAQNIFYPYFTIHYLPAYLPIDRVGKCLLFCPINT